jgi:ferredoxin-thioredoxin reductase catalytic subunit
MTAEELYEKLKKIQEPQGLYFNKDHGMVMDLLNSLLINKERYGYTACPCRLASGVYEIDRDIICPCVYAKPDIEEHGSCFCGLYVSQAWNDGSIPHVTVPERRPQEKTLAAVEAQLDQS